jgi:hypothetical protein
MEPVRLDAQAWRMTSGKAPRRPQTGQVAFENRLPPSYPQRLALETAIRKGLAGLSGRWDVVVDAPGALALVVTVIAPDGSAWTMTCGNPPRRPPETIADTVRAACDRRRWLHREHAAELGDKET